MMHWLFEQISNNNTDRKPAFSVKAINNWYRALRFEIESVHGKSASEQVESCRNFYVAGRSKILNQNCPTGELFERLFFSIVYCMTVDRFAADLRATPWVRPTAIVDWYYAVYFSLRSMLPIFGHAVPEDHSKTAKFVASTFRTHLPYPFDMLACRQKGEEYHVLLDGKQPAFYDLDRVFIQDRSVAQGMLAQYLRGTAAWNVDKTKDAILRDKKLNISNFRSKKSQGVRDSRLTSEIGFLHCAYRQRTKANYRDAIYLSYDYGESLSLGSLIENLAVSAKFASIAAIACAEQSAGRQSIKAFVEDLNNNMRGIANANSSEKYWIAFL